MKKVLCIAIAAFVAVSLVHAEEGDDEPGALGLGYQGIMHDGDIMDNISLRYTPGPIGGQVVIGHFKDDGKEPGAGDYEEWSLTGRVLYNMIDRKQSDFYLGTGLTLNTYEWKSGGSSGDGSYWTLGALAGAEWRFAEIPELGFNFELGYGIVFGDDDGYDELFKGTMVSLGAHYYF